jgi:hypothetical protein
MHARHRFGDVVPSIEADDELAWFFNYAALDCAVRHSGSLAVTEACIEALHSAREIRQRLQKLGVREIDVLDALYTEKRWSRAIERRLGHLAPVVEVLSKTGWLEELVEQHPEEVAAWRQQATRACGHAITAYERVRGDGPSVVPQEDL